MRSKQVSDQEVINALFSVIRAHGYAGANLSILSRATRLKKASLYHRYPGGKKEMAADVLRHVHDFIHTHIYKVCTDVTVEPTLRLQNVLLNIHQIYDGGNKHCVLKAMTIDDGIEHFGHQIAGCFKKWMLAFEKLAVALGHSKKSATETAELAVMIIQGALVVSKATSARVRFKRALQKVRDLYTG